MRLPLYLCVALVTTPLIGSMTDSSQRGGDCGPKCLYVGLVALGAPKLTYSELANAFVNKTSDGVSLQALSDVAAEHGFHTAILQTNLDEIARIKRPFVCIAFVQGNHFVLIKDIGKFDVEVVDPPNVTKADRNAFNMIFKGDALIISPAPIEFQKRASLGYFWLTGVACVIFLMFVAVRFRRDLQGS